MKRCVVVLLAVMLVAGAQANLVSNGDFETGDLTDWWSWSPDETTQSISIESTIVSGGSYSVAMVSATDGSWQELGTNGFAVDADTTYSLSLDYYNVGWDGAGINLKFWDADWNEVGDQQWYDMVYSTEEGTETWTAFSTDFTTVTGATYLEVKISQGGWGTLYVDNASVVVPEPATLLLLGLGTVVIGRRRRV